METSFANLPSQPHKVKNILIRYSCSTEVRFNSPYQHPEASYLRKYSPKYYKSLTLEITRQSSLLSKAKKIKKLKRFTGLFKDSLPLQLWFDLLANNRKEIEEMPEIVCNNTQTRLSQAWKSLNLQKMKSFLNVRRLSQPKWKSHRMMDDSESLLYGKERSLDYLWGLRKLKSLEITVNGSNFMKVKCFLEHLNGMRILLDRLENLSIKVRMKNKNVQELFTNKNVLSHLTNLSFRASFDPIIAEIPQMCKKLNSLSLNFFNDVSDRPEFLSLLPSMQHLSHLKSVELDWGGTARSFWSHFKPHPSLRCLQLKFNERLFEDKSFLEGDYWEDIQELDILELNISSEKAQDMTFVRSFVTMILKKVCKVHILRFCMRGHMDPSQTYEPFFVKEVPHLYESLEEFELSLYDWNQGLRKFDLKMMNPFRNLKALKLRGNGTLYDHLEKAVTLLEENQKEGDYPVLESTIYLENGQDWLRDTLKKISEVKRKDRNLRMLLELNFKSHHYVDILEKFERDFQVIKGLEIHLICFDSESLPMPVEEIKEFFSRSPKIRNWRASLDNGSETWEFIKVDGEKEQFFVTRPG